VSLKIIFTQYRAFTDEPLLATPNIGDKITGMQTDPLMKSESIDNVSKLSRYLQKIAQPFLAQFASFKPASAVIPLVINRDAACNAIAKELQKRSPGVEICGKSPNTFTLSCKVNAKRKL
jgi:hypothetical protein